MCVVPLIVFYDTFAVYEGLVVSLPERSVVYARAEWGRKAQGWGPSSQGVWSVRRRRTAEEKIYPSPKAVFFSAGSRHTSFGVQRNGSSRDPPRGRGRV